MKRLIICLLLLTLICAGGVWNISSLKTLTDELSTLLNQAEQAAVADDWAEAERLTQQALDLWEKKQLYVYVALLHDEIEGVESSFKGVEAYIRWQETPEYTASNAVLLAQIEHVWEAERFCLENLF